ncbi:MAG: ParB/RepB/Spo0J family partition protein [Oscillospiraceae bacterium]|nr:ParB/RepB/Spo0J family partition protein [Oscillospiraceae bacterium]
MKKPSGLGRGLGALFGDNAFLADDEPDANRNGGVTTLPITDVENNSAQPRKNFDPESLAQLADSIRQHGIIQPLTVRKLDSGYYQIIAGERRWRAARMAGLDEVPVIVVEADDKAAAELAMIENLQREDLNPMEEAAGYRTLIDLYGMTQEEAAERVGKSRSAVANALRLLDLSEPVRAFVEEGKLTAGHARALITLPADLQERTAKEVMDGGLSVRQTERLAKQRMEERRKPETILKREKLDDPKKIDYTVEAQKELSAKLGRGVKIVNGRKKGHIELDYYGLDDLNALLDALALLQINQAREEYEE